MLKMKRNVVPAVLAAALLFVVANSSSVSAGDAGGGIFAKENALSTEILAETRGLGAGGIEGVGVDSSASGGSGAGGAVTFGESTFGNFGGANNNAFATAPGASAVAQMTINVYLTGGAN